jgi:type I restriction enzyme R subunit
MKPYEDYVQPSLMKPLLNLIKITPTVNSVNDLESEDDELEFIKAFRELMRIKNILWSICRFSNGKICNE